MHSLNRFVRHEDFLKNPDTWLDILVLDHIEVPLAKGCASFGVTPNALTLMSIAARIGAVVSFLHFSLVVGATAYICGLVLDGLDGKVARLTDSQSESGRILDLSGDFGLFVALWLSLAWALQIPSWVAIPGAALGVASAFATAIASSNVTNSSMPRNEESSRSMVALPGVLEMHFVTFGIAPFLGASAVTVAMGLCTLYFAGAWVGKLLRTV